MNPLIFSRYIQYHITSTIERIIKSYDNSLKLPILNNYKRGRYSLVIEESCARGYIDILEWIVDNIDNLPYVKSRKTKPLNQIFFPYCIDLACSKNQIEVLIFAAKFHVYPTSNGIDSACRNGSTDIIVWGLKQIPPINPTKTGMNNACYNDNGIEILNLGIPLFILPTEIGMNNACYNNQIRVLNWGLTIPLAYGGLIKPSQYSITEAYIKNNMELLIWGMHINLYPKTIDLNASCWNGFVDLLEWGYNLPCSVQMRLHGQICYQQAPFIPSFVGMDSACKANKINVLEWGASKLPKILPTQIGMNFAKVNNHTEILEFGKKHGILLLNSSSYWDFCK